MSSCIASPFLLFFSDFLGSSLVRFNPKEVSFSLAPQNPAVIPAVGIKNTTHKPNTLISVAFGFSHLVLYGVSRWWSRSGTCSSKQNAGCCGSADSTTARRGGPRAPPRRGARGAEARRGSEPEGRLRDPNHWKKNKFWGGFMFQILEMSMILFQKRNNYHIYNIYMAF